MKQEHTREDELEIQIIGLQGKIERLKRENKKLIAEFIMDEDFIYSKIYNYLYKYRQKKLTDLDAIVNMIYFYHISRRKKWEKRSKKIE